MKEISLHIEEIKKACLANNVRALFAFGSVIQDNLKPDSDIDLLVEIDESDPISYSDCYFNLKFSLEKMFERQVDLLERKTLKNPFFKDQIEKNMVPVYGK